MSPLDSKNIMSSLRRASFGLLCCLTLFCMSARTGWAALSQPIVQEFFVPLPDQALQTSLKAIDTTGTPVGNTLKAVIAIVTGATNTVVVYDHWEDSYESDINNPVQSTTQIWGDGNTNNGVAPGYPSDILPVGAVIILTNTVTLPRNPATINYDGSDRIASTKPVVVTRAGWGIVPGTVLTSASPAYDTTRWGTEFELPIGTNVNAAVQNFSYSAVYIMASQNGTVVQVDRNADGVIEQTNTLNMGDNLVVTNIVSGTMISATKPVQVHELTGRIGSAYQSRTFAIRPKSQWDTSYHATVGTTLASEVHNVFVFNPYHTNMTVLYQTATGSGSFQVSSNSSYKFPMPLNSGGDFYTTNGLPFYAFGANDSGGAATANQTHDWGYSLQPDSALTTVAICGWCPGSDGSPPSNNGNPVWVTPLNSTVIYVNYSNNPAVGPFTAPNGLKYHTNFIASTLSFVRVYNPTTRDMTGARIFTADGTRFSAVWGEDPATAGPGSPYLDMGLSVLPFPTPTITKSSRLVVDVNSNGLANIGDTLEYTIRVANQSLLPVSDVLVVDSLPTNVTYVPGTTTLNGAPVADNSVPPAATRFPLDESGITLPTVPVNTNMDLVFRVTINAAGTIINNVSGATADTLWTNSASTTVAVLPSATNTPSCSLSFADSGGSAVVSYASGAGIYVTLTDTNLNTSTTTVESVTVLVQNSSNGDQEFLTLTETGANTGIFRNTSALPSSTTGGLSQQDGTLYALPGQTLLVSFVNPSYGNTCSANATISSPSNFKKLYLSDPSQALDRIDPVATEDATTASTAVLGGSGGTGAIAVDATSYTNAAATATTLTIRHATGSGVNRLMLVGIGFGQSSTGVGGATVSTVKYGSQSLTRLTAVQDTGSTVRTRTEIWQLLNPDAGTTNVVITLSAAKNVAAGVMTFTGVDQAAPFSRTNSNFESTGSIMASNVIASAAGELVFQSADVDGDGTATTFTPLNSITSRWFTNSANQTHSLGSTKAGAASVTNAWRWTTSQQWSAAAVSIKPSTSGGATSTSFVQLTNLCSNLVLPAGGVIAITNYISNITGTLPATPNVTAVLRYGSTPFATMLTATNNSGGTLVWTSTLVSNATIPAGSAITLDVTNRESGVSFQVDYDSSTKPSVISLPTTTIINVDSLGLYTGAYPSATVAGSANNGQTIYVRVAVSDPFGSYDVNHLTLAVTDPSLGVSTVTLTNVQVVADDGCVKTYEYPWVTGSLQGNYQLLATAYEGTEGITATRSTTLYIANQDLGTPSATQFTFGDNGSPTNSYYAGTNVCVRVIDLNRNTNATTVDTVSAVVTASTGDRETITLTETGPNTGIFTGCMATTNTAAATTNNAVLSVIPGATVNVTYTDTTDPSDVTSDNATIKPANAAIPGVSVSKTLTSPASGLAEVGSTVSFNILIANSGTVTVTNVLLADTNSSSQYQFTGASVAPTVTITNGGVILSNYWSNLGPLAVGASTNVSVSYKVLVTGSLTNSALVIGSATNGPSRAYVSVFSTSLAIGKSIVTPVPGPAYISNIVVFRIGLTNTGTTSITTLPLEDSYSAGALQYLGATPAPAGAGGGQILWANLGPLAAGANTSVYVTNMAVGASSPTVNNATVNYGVDANGNAVPPVQTSTNINIVGGSIGTNVWFDANANGVYDAGDSPLAGVVVYMDSNDNGVRDSGELFATTDSSGNYLISSLAASTYIVRLDTNTLPAGVRPTYDLNGTNTAHVVSGVILTNGQNRADLNFGYTGSGSIGGYAWYDVNGDGLQQGTEPALGGVRVFIDANGSGAWDTNEIYQFTTTAGFYTFSNLVAGTYNIAVDYSTLPVGAVCTGDPDATKNGTTTTILTAGQNVTSDDFGFQGNGSITGSVLVDVNGNGVFDGPDTTGISGVMLVLQTTNGVNLATNVTTSGGAYRFANLLPGTYVVVETNLPGWTSTGDTAPPNDDRIPVTLAGGQASAGNSFLDTQPAQITGSVKLDINGNGTADAEDNNAITPVVITVYTNGLTLVATLTNSADGSFSVANLPPGNYTVVQAVPTGYVATSPSSASIALALTSAGTSTASFLDLVTFSIGNRVFADLNNDGNRDFGDEGISGVRMVVFTNNLGSPSGSPLMVTNTDANGDYRFDGLRAGTYVVVVDQANSANLSGYASSTGCTTNLTIVEDMEDHGQDTPVSVGGVVNGIASVAVTLGLGLQPTNEIVANPAGMGQHGPSGDLYDNLVLDFGFTPTYSIGNRVFSDANNNGTMDGGEGGISAVHLKLFAADSSGNPAGSILASANSDSSGYYRFDGLVAATYVVVVDVTESGSALTGLVSSTGASTNLLAAGDLKDHGLDTLVSVGGVVNGIAGPPVTVGDGLQPTGEATGSGAGSNGPTGDASDNLVVDFGFTPAYSAGNRVFLDNGAGSGTANNGIQDGDEPGIQNVNLHLYAADGSGNPTGADLADVWTDASGYYRFDGIPSGTYVVVVHVLGSATALNGLQSSTVVSSDNTLTGDLHNHGKVTPLGSGSVLPGGIASGAFTLAANSQPLSETVTSGTGAGAHGSSGDASDNLVIDFGFASVSDFFSIGSRVFRDDGSGSGHSNNGIQDGTELGIQYVAVKLYAADGSGNPIGTELASTTTDVDGDYSFSWGPGNYVVIVDVAGSVHDSANVLSGLQSSHGASTDFTGTGDARDHGKDTPLGSGSVLSGGIASDAFTVGPATSSADFGFAPSADFFSIGHRVFNDNGTGGATANDGLQSGTEPGISNVVVKLFAADGSGVPAGSVLDTQTTDVDGYYRFDGVGPGTYVVVADKTNSPTLATYLSSTGYLNTTSTAGQYYDHGKDTPVTVTGAVTNGIASGPVTVVAGSQPTAEYTSGSGAGANGPAGDASDNLNLNFGFTPTYSIGNRIYRDPDNDGQPDLDNLDEGGINGVLVAVFAADGSGNPIGSELGRTTTSGNGFYRFDGLVAGTYVVVVDKANSPALDAFLCVTDFSTNTGAGGDVYNHGKPTPLGLGSVLPGGIATVPVTLGVGLQPLEEATGEGQGANGPSGDAGDNLTLDIGFAPLYSIGNRVFLDNGAGGGTRNNGIQDGSEPGVAGVVVKLFAANGSGNPMGTALGTTNTDDYGYYRFDGLPAGLYVVVVDQAHSANLTGYVSSTGASSDMTVTGDGKDHGIDTPLGSGSVLEGGIVGGVVLLGQDVVAPKLEPDISGTGAGAHGPNGDDADNLVMDFGFTLTRLSGTVFDDANGLTDGIVNGNGTNVNGLLYANLVAAGTVQARVAVASDGTYSFNNLPSGSYTVQVTVNAGTVGQPMPATALPSNWVNTGEHLGAGAGSDGTAGGLLSVTVAVADVSNANFGIESLPDSAAASASQMNPGGTATVTVPALAGSDMEDGVLGSGNTVIIETVPGNATLYYDGSAVTAGQAITGYLPAKLTVDPGFEGSGTVTFTFAFKDAAGEVDPTPATATLTFNAVSLAGTVFDDANGLADSTVNGSGTNVNSLLYANLVSAGGTVLASVAVVGDGTYSFSNISSGSDTVQVSTNAGTIGQPMPATALPSGWVNTGEHLGAGAGSDGTPNGLLAVTVAAANVNNANFGIDALPESATASATYMNPGGTATVTVPTLAGSDLEDGVLGSGKTVVIETLSDNATIYYDGGAVTSVQTITSYDPAKLTVDPNFEGGGTVTFTFAFKDAAGEADPTPATVTLTFNGVSLGGTVFDDANGLTDSTVNGTGVNLDGLLHANLVSAGGTVLASVAVAGDGTYSFSNISSGSDTVQVSTIAGTVGQPMPATALPLGWVNTGEHLGAGTGDDGVPNGLLAVTVESANVDNANFGIDALPDSTPASAACMNPGGTATVTVPTLAGSDPEDGALGSGSSVVIKTLPDSATLYYNGGAVTAGQAITSYDPTKLTVDPGFEGAGTVTFTFTFQDAAGEADPTPATATLTFNGVSLSGKVFDDGNGLVDGIVNGTGTNINELLNVNLVNSASGIVLASVPVAIDGTYLFDSISSGSYKVQLSVNIGTVGQDMPATALPSGWVNTGENLGTGAGSDGTPDGLLSVTVVASNVTDADFGIQQTFSIGNLVYADANNNRSFDGGETGISGVQLKLFAANGAGNPTGSALAAVTTDASGYYRFDGLSAGTYVVVADVIGSGAVLNGKVTSTGNSTSLTIAGDSWDHGKDAVLGHFSVLPGGIASVPVTLARDLQPTGESVSSNAGAHGTWGDANDNLVVDFGFYTPDATAAQMAWLGAYADQGRAWVVWQTLSELNLVAFEVWRSTPAGPEELVTPDFVWAGGQAEGNTYREPDSKVLLPGEYTYRLVGWYDDGTSEELARVKVSLAQESSADVVRVTGLEAEGDGMRVRWLGGQPPYTLESSPGLGTDAVWTPVGPAQPGETEALVPADSGSGFFRVRGAAGKP